MLRFLFPLRWTQWLGPLLLAGAGALLLAVIVVTTGLVDLSAAKPHPEGWARFLHYVFDRSTAAHADTNPPADLDSPVRIAAGAAYYGQVCARCHGGPAFGQNPVVLSMHPRPQYLATDLPIAKFTAPELFRIVKAGVKYSAMPSWPADGRDDEVWQLVAFLRALPAMTPAQFQQLALVQHGQASATNTAFGGPAPLAKYKLRNDDEPPLASFSYKAPAFGFSGYALGGDAVATCARCHGADGAGVGAFPNLTLQSRDYLARSLAAFATGNRRSGFMQMVASELSPQQIGALAAYYSALPRRSTDKSQPFPAMGQQIALIGIPSTGLAPCASCHGVTKAAEKAYPLLEGQSRWYLANQMALFRAGGRGTIAGDKVTDPMIAIARKLTDDQIKAVAAYYGAQPPAVVQSFAAVKK